MFMTFTPDPHFPSHCHGQQSMWTLLTLEPLIMTRNAVTWSELFLQITDETFVNSSEIGAHFKLISQRKLYGMMRGPEDL